MSVPLLLSPAYWGYCPGEDEADEDGEETEGGERGPQHHHPHPVQPAELQPHAERVRRLSVLATHCTTHTDLILGMLQQRNNFVGIDKPTAVEELKASLYFE